MRRLFLFVLTLLAGYSSVSAQHRDRLAIRADLTMPLRHGLGGNLEWRYSSKSGLAFQVSWEKHEEASDYGLFEGALVVHYAELQVDSVVYGFPKRHYATLYYLGAGRPIPLLPEVVALSSAVFKLGHNFRFGFNRSRWFVALQPSLCVTRHRYFSIEQRSTLVEESLQLTQSGDYPTVDWTVKKKYRAYQDVQTMQRHDKWLPGIAYDFGLGCRFGKRWTLEARVAGQYNLETAYKAPQPEPVRAIQVRPHLLLGFELGR